MKTLEGYQDRLGTHTGMIEREGAFVVGKPAPAAAVAAPASEEAPDAADASERDAATSIADQQETDSDVNAGVNAGVSADVNADVNARVNADVSGAPLKIAEVIASIRSELGLPADTAPKDVVSHALEEYGLQVRIPPALFCAISVH
jgi:hypothetical protein